MKIAIFALTRGYPNEITKYDDLLKRNMSIFYNINNKRENPADLILFHEGNISKSDQQYINSQYPEEIKFVNVAKYFQKTTLPQEGGSKFNSGYRYMCRFNGYHIWDELSEYDYILRVDEDIEIIDFDPHVFEYMKKNNITYMTGRFTKDTHDETNNTLPAYLSEHTNLDVPKVYNHKNPYTNLYASSVEFWQSSEVNSILKKISLSDEQFIYRWGDHTLHGIMLNHKKKKIKLFPKLEYRHISHELTIKNNLLRNILINSKFNPVSIKEGPFTKIKIRIKSIFFSKNSYDYRKN